MLKTFLFLTFQQKMTGEHGLKPRQIALLSPYRRENTCLAGQESIQGYRLADYSRRSSVSATDVLFHDTITSFKGLETDVAIVHDLRAGEWARDPS
ncbi:MAG: hypothetical protein V1904_10005, partial [Bacteroidota bacterium]